MVLDAFPWLLIGQGFWFFLALDWLGVLASFDWLEVRILLFSLRISFFSTFESKFNTFLCLFLTLHYLAKLILSLSGLSPRKPSLRNS